MDNEQCHILRAPDDVLIVILHSLDSINALISFTSTCRQLRSLFEHFPRQICASVTNTRLGIYASSDPTNIERSCFPFLSPPESADAKELREFVVQDSLRIERLLALMERTTVWLTDPQAIQFNTDEAEAADFVKLRSFRLVDSEHPKFAFCALIYYYHKNLHQIKDYVSYYPPLPPTVISPRETGCWNLVKMQVREIFRKLNEVRRRRMFEAAGVPFPLLPPAPGDPPEGLARDDSQVWPLYEYYYAKIMLEAEVTEQTGGRTRRMEIPLLRQKCVHTAPRIREDDNRDIFTRNALPIPRNANVQQTGNIIANQIHIS